MDLLRKGVSVYNLLLAFGAFYMGTAMFLGEGVFAEFPEKWIGRLLVRSWSSLALFGILVFGVGNAAVAVRGFKRGTNRIFWLAAIMGGVLFLASAVPVILIGEWYIFRQPSYSH